MQTAGASGQIAASTANVLHIALERPLDHYSQAEVLRAKDAIADFLAVTVAARVEPLAETAARAFRLTGSPRTRVAQHPLDVEACASESAYLGFLSHLLDFDDMGGSIRGHPSGPVLSSALTLAAKLGATGRDLLAAYMTAADGMALVGRSVATAVQQRGLHPTAVLGALGSVLACSRLLGLSPERAAGAASLALAQVAGTNANFGTPGKPMQVGLGSASGCRAAILASSGIVGATDPVESLQRQTRSEVPSFRVHEMVGAGSTWEEKGIRFKRFPSCALTHQSIEAAHIIRQRINVSETSKIHVTGSYRVATMLKYPLPQDLLQAKFCLPYCLAIGLLYDRPLLPRMVSASLDEEALRLARRVTFEVHSDLTNVDAIDREFTEVAITLRSGETVLQRVSGTVQLESRAELREKFNQCFALVGAEDREDGAWETVHVIGGLASVGDRFARVC